MSIKSSWPWKATYTLARLMVGDHHKVKRMLRIGQFFVLHGIVELGILLPEETFPGEEIGALKQSVVQNIFYTAQRLYHVCVIIVQVSKVAIVTLMRPPERFLLQHLILLEL